MAGAEDQVPAVDGPRHDRRRQRRPRRVDWKVFRPQTSNSSQKSVVTHRHNISKHWTRSPDNWSRSSDVDQNYRTSDLLSKSGLERSCDISLRWQALFIMAHLYHICAFWKLKVLSRQESFNIHSTSHSVVLPWEETDDEHFTEFIESKIIINLNLE